MENKVDSAELPEGLTIRTGMGQSVSSLDLLPSERKRCCETLMVPSEDTSFSTTRTGNPVFLVQLIKGQQSKISKNETMNLTHP